MIQLHIVAVLNDTVSVKIKKVGDSSSAVSGFRFKCCRQLLGNLICIFVASLPSPFSLSHSLSLSLSLSLQNFFKPEKKRLKLGNLRKEKNFTFVSKDYLAANILKCTNLLIHSNWHSSNWRAHVITSSWVFSLKLLHVIVKRRWWLADSSNTNSSTDISSAEIKFGYTEST